MNDINATIWELIAEDYREGKIEQTTLFYMLEDALEKLEPGQAVDLARNYGYEVEY